MRGESVKEGGCEGGREGRKDRQKEGGRVRHSFPASSQAKKFQIIRLRA